jgi:hypothetical protein
VNGFESGDMRVSELVLSKFPIDKKFIDVTHEIEKFEMSCFVFSLTETVVFTPFCIENPAPKEPNCLESSLSNSALKKPVMCAGQNAVAIMIKPTWMENINTWLK